MSQFNLKVKAILVVCNIMYVHCTVYNYIITNLSIYNVNPIVLSNVTAYSRCTLFTNRLICIFHKNLETKPKIFCSLHLYIPSKLRDSLDGAGGHVAVEHHKYSDNSDKKPSLHPALQDFDVILYYIYFYILCNCMFIM